MNKSFSHEKVLRKSVIQSSMQQSAREYRHGDEIPAAISGDSRVWVMRLAESQARFWCRWQQTGRLESATAEWRGEALVLAHL